eukprot:scaffold5.g669.t1
MLHDLPSDCWSRILRELSQRDRCALLGTSKRVAAALDHTAWPSMRVAADKLGKTRDSVAKAAAFSRLRTALQRHRPAAVTIGGFIGSGRLLQVFQGETKDISSGASTSASAGASKEAAADAARAEGSSEDAGTREAAAEERAPEAGQPPHAAPPSALLWTQLLQELTVPTTLAGLVELAGAVPLPALRSLTVHFLELSNYKMPLPDLSTACPRLEALHLRWLDKIAAVSVDASALGALGPRLRSLTLSAAFGAEAHVRRLAPALRRMPRLAELRLLDLSLAWEEENKPSAKELVVAAQEAADEAAAAAVVAGVVGDAAIAAVTEAINVVLTARPTLPESLEHLSLVPPTPHVRPRPGSVLPHLARLPRLRTLELHWWMADTSNQVEEDWDDGEVKARLNAALPAVEELSVVVEGGGTLFLGLQALLACPSLRRLVVDMADRQENDPAFRAYAHLIVDGSIQALAALLSRVDLAFAMPAAQLHMLPPAMFQPDVVESLELHGAWERGAPTPLTAARLGGAAAQQAQAWCTALRPQPLPMCGRTRCTLGRAQLERVVPGTQRWINEASYEPCHNAAPGRDLPIIHQTAEGEVVIETARWGLVPAFTKPTDKPNHWSMFNARSESVTEKPSFRRLVPEKDGKQPYYLHLAGDEPMVIAGLYDAWQSPSGPLVSFTILTSDASPRLAWLHDRQPLLLHSREAQALWLDTGNPASVNKLQTVLGSSYGGEDLVWHAVTRAMSRIGYQAPDASAPLTKPAAAAQDGSAGAAAREGGRAGPVHTERLTAEGAAGGMQPKLEQQEGGGAAEGREVKQEPASQERRRKQQQPTWIACCRCTWQPNKATRQQFSCSWQRRLGRQQQQPTSVAGCRYTGQFNKGTRAAASETATAADLIGYLALHWAAWQGHPAAMQLLLAAGPGSGRALTSNGRSVLQLAASQAHLSSSRVLVGRSVAPACQLIVDLLAAAQDPNATPECREVVHTLLANLATSRALSTADWARLPSPYPGLERALRAVLARSAAEAAQLVAHLPDVMRGRLRTLALSLARLQGRLELELPESIVCRILTVAPLEEEGAAVQEEDRM